MDLNEISTGEIIKITEITRTPNESNSISTNKVLLQFPSQYQDKYTFYLPSFLRIRLQNFTQISLANLNATLIISFRFDVDVTGLPQQLIEVVQQKLKLRFHHNDEVEQLKQNTFSSKIYPQSNHYLMGCSFKRAVSVRIFPQIFLTPFEKLFLQLSISAQNLLITTKQIKDLEEVLKECMNEEGKKRIEKQKPDNIMIKFNFMDFSYKKWYKEDGVLKDYQIKISYGEQTYFGNYDLAQKLLKVQYTNNQKSERLQEQYRKRNSNSSCCLYCEQKPICCSSQNNNCHEEEKEELCLHQFKGIQKIIKQNFIKPFHYAHFQIPLYKIPTTFLCTVFLPIWLVGFLSLIIFFQDISIGSRIAPIAIVMLSYISYMPIVRRQLPPNPRITFLQLLIYLQIGQIMLCMLETFLQKDNNAYTFNWMTNPLFLISLSIQIFQFFTIFFMIAWYYCYSLPRYNIDKGQVLTLYPMQWKNEKCNDHFTEIVKKNGYHVSELIVKKYA